VQQAQALAAYYVRMKESEDWTAERLTPLLAGLLELILWLKQWHNDLDSTHGVRMGDYFADFAAEEARELGLTPDQIRGWTRPARTTGAGGEKAREGTGCELRRSHRVVSCESDRSHRGVDDGVDFRPQSKGSNECERRDRQTGSGFGETTRRTKDCVPFCQEVVDDGHALAGQRKLVHADGLVVASSVRPSARLLEG
jgi:hypothetical protein